MNTLLYRMTEDRQTKRGEVIKINLFALHPVNEFPFIGESQGVCAISGFLQQRYGDAVSIDVYDQQFIALEEFVGHVLADKPDLIGVSVKMLTFNQFELLYAALKKDVFPQYTPLVIVGNSTAHFSGSEILRRYPDVIVSLGEGEVSFGDLVEYAAGRIQFESIRNVIYLRNGTICHGAYEYLDRKSIPIADRRCSKLFYESGGEVYIEGSRGCAYCGCSICECRDFLGSRNCEFRWRDRPIESIIEELKILQNLNIGSVTFADEDFIGDDNYGLKRAALLADEIVKHEILIKFRINARVRALYAENDTPDQRRLKRATLIALKKAGLSKVFLGFESGDQTQLKRYNKGFLLPEFIEAKKALMMAGIDFELGYICLDPLMTLEELEVSLKFIGQNNCIPHISAIYKELRIQTGNVHYRNLVEKFEKAHSMQILGKLLFHEQMYEIVRYADSRVEKFRQVMREYEQQTYKIYYYLRILTQYSKNDHEGSLLTANVYETIELLKCNDYDLMIAVLNVIKHMEHVNWELKHVLTIHRDIRKKIYQSLINRVSECSVPETIQLKRLYCATYGD